MPCVLFETMSRFGEGNSSSIRKAPHSGDVMDPRLAQRAQQERARPLGCCGGRDLGPLCDHEGPSDEDIERFSNPTRACPECNTEVYDDTELCWNCGHAFRAQPGKLPTWVLVTAGLVIGGFVLVLVV